MIAAIPAFVVAAAAAATHEEKSGLPQLNPADFSPQLIWLALTFVVLYLILARVALPRIGEVLDERRDRVQRDLDAAERFKADTDAALAAYEKALSDAHGKASSMAKDMRDKLTAESNKERAQVEGELAARLTEAEGRIANTKAKALQSVNEIAAETASAVVGKLLGEEVSPAEVKKVLQPAAE
jgi:F-type H+-transporting ATPase subunit b